MKRKLTIELNDAQDIPICFRMDGIIGVRHTVPGEPGVAAIMTSYGPFYVLNPYDEIVELMKDD